MGCWQTAGVSQGRHARVRAPELVGRGGWIGTGGKEYSLADLRGKFVLLDFWTFCCINCLHVIEELRPLEEKYADVLVVVGVHSPKFVHEADHAAVVAAVERYDVRPPGPRRPRPRDLGRVRRPRLADARAGRPRGLRRRAVLRRGPCARHRRAARSSWSPSTRRRARCTAATARTSRRAARLDAAVPGEGRRCCRPATGWSPTPATTRLVELAADGETLVRPRSAAGARAASTVRRRGAASTSRTVCACCRPTSPPRWATTSWWPTPSTTRCAGFA